MRQPNQLVRYPIDHMIRFRCINILCTVQCLLFPFVAHAHRRGTSTPSSRGSSRPLSGNLRPQQVRESPDLLQNQNVVEEEEEDGLIDTLQRMIDVLTEGVYRVILTTV